MAKLKKNKSDETLSVKEKQTNSVSKKSETKDNKIVKLPNKLNKSNSVEKKSDTSVIEAISVESNLNNPSVLPQPTDSTNIPQGITPEIQDEDKIEEGELDINLPFDNKTVFIINRGAMFCGGDFLNQFSGTKIQRTGGTTFVMGGLDLKGIPFGQSISQEKDKVDKEWCDWLYAELVDYTKNPEKYTTQMAPLPSELGQHPNVTPPVQHSNDQTTNTQVNQELTQHSIQPESVETKQPEKDFNGVPITKHNINDLLNIVPNYLLN